MTTLTSHTLGVHCSTERVIVRLLSLILDSTEELKKKNTEIFTVTPHCTRNHSQTTNQKFLGWPLWQKTNEDQANQFLSCVKTVPEGSLYLGSVFIAEQNSQTVPGHSSTVLL